MSRITPSPELSVGGWIDKSDSRSQNTEYQNSTGGILEIYVLNNVNSSGGIEINAGETSASEIIYRDLLNLSSGDINYMWATGYALIPDGYYYEISRGDSMEFWYEREVKI